MLEQMERAINALYQLILAGHALQMATSFGKDSMCTSILSMEAIRRATAAGVKQAVHFVTTASTTIENPAMERHVLECLDELQQFCEDRDLPVEIHIATPTLAAQFVVSTIVPTDGLRSYVDEQWNPYRHPERPVTWAGTSQGERVVYFTESDELTVDAEAACAFVTCSFDYGMYQNAQQHVAIESARFWLNEKILRLATGTAYKYQEMAKRGQYFANLRDKLNLTPSELDAYLVRNAISEATHEALLIKAEAENQMDLFHAA